MYRGDGVMRVLSERSSCHDLGLPKQELHTGEFSGYDFNFSNILQF